MANPTAKSREIPACEPSRASGHRGPGERNGFFRNTGPDDLAFQNEMLRQVSRTFALTIPQLPRPLDTIVGNAYLWCRIADTVEDESLVDETQRLQLLTRLQHVLDGSDNGEAWIAEADAALQDTASEAERRLIAGLMRVHRVSSTFTPLQRQAIQRCLRRMSHGMATFGKSRAQVGLRDLKEMDRYCYSVAGVVGEMLTELFCLADPCVDAKRQDLQANAISFGLGLQITNILKDIWEDSSYRRCWLPRDLFERHGYDLNALNPDTNRPAFNSAIGELVGIAHGHLRNAMTYTLTLPSSQSGMRRFCLWATLFAALTLQRIYAQPAYSSAADVKISRAKVLGVISSTRLLAGFDQSLTWIFERSTKGLPLTSMDPRALSRRSLSV